MRSAHAVEPLIAALRDDFPFVRRFAAQALGEIGDTRAVSPLTAISGDSDAGVRTEVTYALENLGYESEGDA